MEKLIGWLKKNPIKGSVCMTMAVGMVIMYALLAVNIRMSSTLSISWLGQFLCGGALYGALIGALILYPLVLTVVNAVGVLRVPDGLRERRTKIIFEVITLVLGSLYTPLAVALFGIQSDAEWSEQLYNSQAHQPIWSEASLTVIVLCLVGVMGYLVLALVRLEKLPPLVTVLSISAMYLGLAVGVVWCIQVANRAQLVLMLFPVNCVLIAAGLLRRKIAEWNRLEEMRGNEFSARSAAGVLSRILRKAELWPLLALLFVLPLLGIVLGVLVLIGQRPDAAVKAWTETADWTLSARTAPPNVMRDEHYLCTVAAGGHEKVVKPLRMGERHGHRVVVNRQLCIANAFEQILEEKTPRFHRAVRHIYDTYGFPIARLIRTKGAADVVYVLMKPLEWLFLIVLYLCDTNPENRIAVQYLPKPGKKLSGTGC